MELDFGVETKQFIGHIVGLQATLPIVMAILEVTDERVKKNFIEFVTKNGLEILEQTDDSTTFKVAYELYHEFNKLSSKVESTELSYKIVPRSFVVSLISQYDAFLGRVIRTILHIKPEILNSSEKNLTYSQLIKFSSLDEVKELIIEKEIETVLRKSHSEQFDWLENKLDMPLRKDLSIWPKFIELTERRNLFVHCNGIISSQYISVCNEHKVEHQTECRVGGSLSVTPEYFYDAYMCIFEVGVKLAQVIWRKLQPTMLADADDNLNDICFSLICKEEYKLAIKLLEFATHILKKWGSDVNRRMFIINKAQCYKWDGQNDTCVRIINSEDWSSCDYRFLLAKSVLLDDFNRASELMCSIGVNGPVKKSDYRDWPLFKEFNKSEIFNSTYKAIYGEEFCCDKQGVSENKMINKDLIQEVAVTIQ